MTRWIAIAALLMGALVGCNMPLPQDGVPEDALAFDIDDNRIGAGDTLRINVWPNDNLPADLPVRPAAKASSPQLGDRRPANRPARERAEAFTRGRRAK